MEHTWYFGYYVRMETYTNCRPFIDNPHFKVDRKITLHKLDINLIDFPLIKLVQKMNRLPHLFTLQCCHGHFLKMDGKEISNLELSETTKRIKYRLAYIAFCIENSPSGRHIRKKLMKIPLSTDRDNIQFCSAQWFWKQWPNSYAIQVMPKRFKDRDTAQVEFSEAREIAKVRDDFFALLKDFMAGLSH